MRVKLNKCILCTDCFLINYVHPAQRGKKLPCHFIPLNPEGETIYSLLRIGDVEKLEQLLLEWLDSNHRAGTEVVVFRKSAQTEKGPA